MSVYIPWWLMIAPALVVSAGLTMALALILIRVWFIVVDRALHLARAHRLFVYFVHNRGELTKIVEKRRATTSTTSTTSTDTIRYEDEAKKHIDEAHFSECSLSLERMTDGMFWGQIVTKDGKEFEMCVYTGDAPLWIRIESEEVLG